VCGVVRASNFSLRCSLLGYRCLEKLGTPAAKKSDNIVEACLEHPSAAIRAAALQAVGELGKVDAHEAEFVKRLQD